MNLKENQVDKVIIKWSEVFTVRGIKTIMNWVWTISIHPLVVEYFGPDRVLENTIWLGNSIGVSCRVFVNFPVGSKCDHVSSCLFVFSLFIGSVQGLWFLFLFVSWDTQTTVSIWRSDNFGIF